MSEAGNPIAATAPRIIGVFTPESTRATVPELLKAALFYRDLGADVLDLDTTPGGAFADADEDLISLLAAGLAAAEAEVSITTTRARLAVAAAEHGVGTIIDPSGATADPDMLSALGDLGTTIVLGPWGRMNGEYASQDLSGAEIEDRYTEGIVRNIAALLDVGVRSEQLRIHAGAGIAADDPDRWRMLNHLERLGGLGYPFLVPATDDVLAAMVADETEEALDDVATALTLLSVGAGAWAIRVRRVGRVEAAIQRIVDRPAEHLTR